MKLHKLTPYAATVFAAATLVAGGGGCTHLSDSSKGSLSARLFKRPTTLAGKASGRQLAAEGDSVAMATNGFFNLVNDPQGEIDPSTPIFKGLDGVSAVVSYPRTAGVQCAMGEDVGTEDENGRVVFKVSGAQEIVCRNTSPEPMIQIEAQYLVDRTQPDWSVIEGGVDHAKLVNAKKELTEGKFNGGLAQYLEQFNLLTTNNFTIKASMTKPLELKFKSNPGEYIQLSVVGDGRVARTKSELKRLPIGPAGIDMANGKKFFNTDKSLPDCFKKNVKDPRCGLLMPEQPPYSLVCMAQDANAKEKVRIVSSGGGRFETNQAVRLYCVVNSLKKQAKSAAGFFNVRVLVGDTKTVAQRIESLLQGVESARITAAKQQDEKIFATILAQVGLLTQQSYASFAEYEGLMKQRAADAAADEAAQLADADKYATDLFGQKYKQVLHETTDLVSGPAKPESMTAERVKLIEEMETKADAAVQKLDAEKFKNPRSISETFFERTFMFSLQARPYTINEATATIDLIISDPQMGYRSAKNDPHYTSFNPFIPHTLIPTRDFYVEERLTKEQKAKKMIVVCAKDLPKLTDLVKSYNQIIESGETAEVGANIMAKIDKLKISDDAKCSATEAAPIVLLDYYRRLQTYRFCYEEKTQEGFNGRLKYKETVFSPAYIELTYRAASINKNQSVRIESGDHPFFASKVRSKTEVGGTGSRACVEINEFMPKFGETGKIIGGKVVMPTAPVRAR